MSSFFFTSNNVLGPSTRANMGTTLNATTFVGDEISVISTTDTVIAGAGIGQSVTVMGTVMSVAAGAASLTGTDGLAVVHDGAVVQGAAQSAQAALDLTGSAMRAEIYGTVLGADGLALGVGGYAFVTGTVSGIGTAAGRGIVLDMAATGTADLRIEGQVRGLHTAVAVEGAGTGTVALFNAGQINGSVLLGAGADMVRNASLIDGDLHLGEGVNTYRARAEGEVTGVIYGGDTVDRVYGGDRADHVESGRGGDILHMGGGDDYAFGDIGNDTIYGQDGNDSLLGARGRDMLSGAAGDDILEGGGQEDDLRGGRGDDILDGGSEADILNGGRGEDVLTGGQGADTFVFGRSANDDLITDFEDGTDLIDLTRFGLADFAALDATGALVDQTNGALIDLQPLGGAGSILLQGVSLSLLGDADFLF